MSSPIAKPGIVSILLSECDQTTKATSLRRNLSADMSSKQWLAQNGFPISPIIKRIASSEELANKPIDLFDEKPCQAEIWASIVSQKVTTLPYVHPLVKRSTSALSEKSLEICTESLGSETGSDGFSSAFESGDKEEGKDGTKVTQQEKEWQDLRLEEGKFSKPNLLATKKSPPKPFPPPLPTLHMQHRREDGRLVLEAISIPSQNCFRAQRQDGRLLLTFANSTPDQELDLEEAVDEWEEVNEVREEMFGNFEEEDNNYATEEEEVRDEEWEENENEDKELGFNMDQEPNNSREVINVHRSKNPIAQENSPLKINSQSVICPKANQNQEMVHLEGHKGDFLVPLVRSCKENKKRSLLFWEPCCIATS